MQILYAGKKQDEKFWYFFPSVRQVKMCTSGEIYKVGLHLAAPEEETIYWGWLDYNDNQFHMIWPSRLSVEICFTYGTQVEEDRGRKKLVQIIVTELEKIC